MKKITESIGIAIIAMIAAFLLSVVGGTILWLIWEDSIIGMFPKSVESGILSNKLEWWQSVKIVWIFNLLIKATLNNDNSK